jgi:hypothetical protein
VRALQSAHPLAAAVEAAAAQAPFGLPEALSRLIRHGCLTAWHLSGDSE